MVRALLAAIAVALLAPAGASASLTFAGQWGSAGTGAGQFQVPTGVAADAAGNVYVTDQNGDRIEKFDSNGTPTLAFGGPGALNGPGHLGLDPQGNLLVADEGNYRVLKYSPGGAVLQQYGRFGSNPGQFRGNPRGVAADLAGNVYVIDSGGGGLIDKFAPDGTLLLTFGQQGSGPGQWNTPRGLEVDPAGNVYVGDSGNARIDVFTSAGQFVRSFGAPATGVAQLGFAAEVALDSHGNVFVADDRGIVQYDPNGGFVARVNTATSTSDTFNGLGVAVGPGDQVFATDRSKSRVLRFTQGPPPPQLGKTATVQSVTGTVRIRVPGSKTFADLSKGPGSIPIGSELDATHGSVGLSLSKGGKATQKGTFSQGRFKLLQSKKKSQHGLTQLTLTGGGSYKNCKSGKKARAARSRPHRQLFANVHGHFRTRGRHSTATVRGTKWLTKDTCAGTLTRVMRGTVVVRDFAKHRNVVVKAGHSYLAR